MRSSRGSATTSCWRPHPADPEPGRVGRDGTLALALERRDGATVLGACRYRLPLQVLSPMALDDPAAVVSVLNPTGGLVGGDRLTIDVTIGPAAHGCLTTPSATKVYRTAGAAAEQRVHIRLGAGAILEWVPDHTIPFAGSAFRQAIDCEAEDGATLILTDAFAAGRIARGEAWRFALLESAVTVRDRRGLILHDRFVLTAARAVQGLGFTENHPYFGSFVVVADSGLDAFAAAAGRLLRETAGAVGGVGALPRRGAVVRCLARSAPALTALVEALWAVARRELLGLPALALRKA